jgi:hypothetical protein
MKIDLSPPIILFYGDEGLYWGFVGNALVPKSEPKNATVSITSNLAAYVCSTKYSERKN